MRADQPQRAPVAITLDLGDDVDPARLAVVRPDDSIAGGIVFFAAGKRVEKLLNRALTIVGVDPLDPVFVGFVGGVRRQTVDDEIFRRTAVLEALAKVDLDAADARDALNSRQFRLAFLQGEVSPVALARDFLQMVPQAFGGCVIGQGVRRIGKRHAYRQPLPVPSHRNPRLCQLHLLFAGDRQL